MPNKKLKRYIDHYIRQQVAKLHPNIKNKNKEKNKNKKYIYYDEDVDPQNWKYSLDTDGMNQISLTRSKFYRNPETPFVKYGKKEKDKYDYQSMSEYVPENVIQWLEKFR